ncbi:MAG TPA: tetratricopeptide repeat protein [Candidatus Saccharimonadales bacterium]|nr:tetratricopeptide repeat protein [Candidatus Saccharimonadales bacterium]
MFSIPLIAIFGGISIWLFTRSTTEVKGQQLPERITEKLDKLWQIAQEGLQEQKYLRAEKALLTILRVDERNAAAYNRLGILYAKQRAFNDAIECFEIAQSLEPSASSLHNVGLIYYETGQYEKAALAFEQAIEMESELSARQVAYAKVQEKLGNNKKMIEALEKAVELEPHPQSLKILADAYERIGEMELAETIKKKIEKIIASPQPQQLPKQIQQPRRMVM